MKLLTGNSNKNLSKKISKYLVKHLLSNILFYLWKKTKVFIDKSDKYMYVTRGEFVKYLFKVLWVDTKNVLNVKLHYIDLKNEDIDLIQNIKYLTKIWFKWKDQFATYHFQPSKNITVWEALYLSNLLLSKYFK